MVPHLSRSVSLPPCSVSCLKASQTLGLSSREEWHGLVSVPGRLRSTEV